MLDYHLHLWPHGQPDRAPSLEQLSAYCDKAAAAGVAEIALTEHLFRFVQADAVLGRWWSNEPDPELAASMARYWDEHARADLDVYVESVLGAKSAGLPVVLGLEVDYYPGAMDQVARLLAGYPFDVLLGSVHWLGTWRFDDLDDPVSVRRWSELSVEQAWDRYTDAVEELAACGACDVLAHPDVVKVAGHRPAVPDEWWDRLAEAAAASGMAAEVSSAGWRKPVGEAYPDGGLLWRLAQRGVPFTTASDAHGLGDVASRVEELQALLQSVGVETLRAYRSRRPVEVPLGDTSPHGVTTGDGTTTDGTRTGQVTTDAGAQARGEERR